MTDHDDDLLAEVGAALDVEPSREFSANVIAQVDASRRTSRTRWALAAAASVALVGVLLWRSSTGSVPPAPAIAATQAPALSVASVQPSAAVRPRGDQRDAANSARDGVRAVVQATQVEPAIATASPAEPRLEVITNQGAVLRALWAASERKQNGVLVVNADEPADRLATRPILVESIVVPSIVVNELGKEPRRDGASAMIRRVAATKEAK